MEKTYDKDTLNKMLLPPVDFSKYKFVLTVRFSQPAFVYALP